MNEEYKIELKKIHGNCLYTAEAHHIIAGRYQRLQRWLQIVPAIIAALTGTLSAASVGDPLTTYLTAVSAIIAAITSVIDPAKRYEQHMGTAKAFTVLKQDADSLLMTFGPLMLQPDLSAAVKSLHERYNDLVLAAPPTDDKSFAKAQDRIQTGVHDPD
jgi:hypothetical protein